MTYSFLILYFSIDKVLIQFKGHTAELNAFTLKSLPQQEGISFY